jgi:hypothetical protein
VSWPSEQRNPSSDGRAIGISHARGGSTQQWPSLEPKLPAPVPLRTPRFHVTKLGNHWLGSFIFLLAMISRVLPFFFGLPRVLFSHVHESSDGSREAFFWLYIEKNISHFFPHLLFSLIRYSSLNIRVAVLRLPAACDFNKLNQ